MAECSKNCLVKVREAASATIVAIDGGYHDVFKVEFIHIAVSTRSMNADGGFRFSRFPPDVQCARSLS